MSSEFCNQGIVKAIHKNTVVVEITIHEACHGCNVKDACTMGRKKQEQISIKIDNPEQFQTGESVLIEIKKSIAYKTVTLAYLFPFLVLVTSLFVTYYISKRELLSIGVSFSVTFIYYLILKKLKNRIDKEIVFGIKKMELL